MPDSTARDLITYTWDDYRTWNDSERQELIDGVPHAMLPALRHEQIEVVKESPAMPYTRGSK